MTLWKWTHFKPHEVLSPDGLHQYERGNLMFQPYALDSFEAFRKFIDRPLLANFASLTLRGYRSPREQASIKGSQLSRHIQGIALDLTCKELSSYDLYKLALDNAKTYGFGAIGYYPKKNFVHIDCRPFLDKPTTWSE